MVEEFVDFVELVNQVKNFQEDSSLKMTREEVVNGFVELVEFVNQVEDLL